MRRIALLAASLIASVALIIFLVPARAAAPTAAGLHKGAANGATPDVGVQLVRRGGGFQGGGFRGGRAFRGGFRGGRAYAYRGGRYYGWRGRGWRPGWGVALGAGALAAAPYYYGGYRCPLVRRVVRTPYGAQERWVRRCY